MVTNTLLSHVVLAALVGCAAMLSLAPQDAKAQASNKKPKAVFTCNIGLLSASEREMLSKIGPQLQGAPHTTRELSNGYEIRFQNGREAFPVVCEWLPVERRCCSFFDFSLSISGTGPLIVRITGPEGVKAFIREELPGLAKLTGSGK